MLIFAISFLLTHVSSVYNLAWSKSVCSVPTLPSCLTSYRKSWSSCTGPVLQLVMTFSRGLPPLESWLVTSCRVPSVIMQSSQLSAALMTAAAPSHGWSCTRSGTESQAGRDLSFIILVIIAQLFQPSQTTALRWCNSNTILSFSLPESDLIRFNDR